MRIPPFSLVSPGCCTLSECVRLRGYTRWRGAPVVLTILLFQKILSTIYVYGDGNTTCVHTRNFIKKVFHKCYTGSWTRKHIRQTKGLTTIIFNKSIFLLVFHLIPKGVLWDVYEWNFQKLFPSKMIYAGQQTVGNIFSDSYYCWKQSFAIFLKIKVSRNFICSKQGNYFYCKKKLPCWLF